MRNYKVIVIFFTSLNQMVRRTVNISNRIAKFCKRARANRRSKLPLDTVNKNTIIHIKNNNQKYLMQWKSKQLNQAQNQTNQMEHPMREDELRPQINPNIQI
jgi:hypothetical protein